MLAFLFFNDTATTEIYTLSLHDALPICAVRTRKLPVFDLAPFATRSAEKLSATVLATRPGDEARSLRALADGSDRKSTRLNSSHANISYAVFCLKIKEIRHSMRSNSK